MVKGYGSVAPKLNNNWLVKSGWHNRLETLVSLFLSDGRAYLVVLLENKI